MCVCTASVEGWGGVCHWSGPRTVDELTESAVELLKEFYVSGELSEAIQCISDLNAAYFHHEVVRRAFLLAVDMSAQEIILFVKLLSKMHASAPESTQIASGFRRVVRYRGS